MRSRWRRQSEPRAIEEADVARLAASACPGTRLLSWRVLPGGLTNTNVLAELDRPPGRVVLRLHQRGGPVAATEQAILRMAQAHAIPAAPLLHVVSPDDPLHPACVLGWVDGEPLDRVLARPGDAAPAGRALGRALALVHAQRRPHPGFLDGALQPGEPIDMGAEALQRFVSDGLASGVARLDPVLSGALVERVRRDAGLLDAWPGGASLVHADLNPGNILLRRTGKGMRMSALLDWEYALAASPALDLGTLLRPGLGDHPAFLEALAAGYRDAGGRLDRQWRATGRLADLFAWFDMLGRTDDPQVRADATLVIRRLLAS